MHQYVLTLFLWITSKLLGFFSCSWGFFKKKERKRKEICKIYLPLNSLFILKRMFHAFAKGVCVGLCFLFLFSPLLSKFHLCFPSRICEKYFQYISLNSFLVLILLPRHLLLTAFGNRILDWMDLGLTQYSCFIFLNAESFVKKKISIYLLVCSCSGSWEAVCGLLLRIWRQIQRCTTAHLSNCRSVPNCNLLWSAEATSMCCNKVNDSQKIWIFEKS